MLARTFSFFRTLIHRRRVSKDLNDEIESYLDLLVAEKQQAGMNPEQARRAALLEIGGVDQVKESVRDVHYSAFIETLARDVKYGLRTLNHNRRFTATAVLSLAVGIGLNSAMFSAINAVLLRPLPYRDAERVFVLGFLDKQTQQPSGLSPANYVEWERQNSVFESMAAVFPFHHNQGRYVLTAGGEPIPVKTLRVSASFFDVLGVQPALGRGFIPEEDNTGSRSVILSHDIWKKGLQADKSIVGRDIHLDGVGYKVVGVLPPGFRYNMYYRGETDVWLSDPFDAVPRTNTTTHGLRPIARLKPGITPEQARAEMAVIARSLERLHPRENKDLALGMAPAATWMVGAGDRSLLLLMGAVGVVLLIACANVANLLLGRASARQREMAVRAAIGAGRGRLIRQLLTESLLLSVAGGCLGLVLAYGTVNALPHILPEKVFRLEEANVDLSVLVFTLTVSIVTGILFGLAPALASARTDVIHALKAAGHTVSHARRGSRLRNALVVVQIALSLVLLAGAGLLLNTLWRLQSVHLGFRPENVYVISCTLPPTAPYVTDLGFKRVAPANPTVRRHYAPENAAKVFAERVVENLKKVPGVNSAGAAVFASPFISSNRTPFRLETQPSLTPEQSSRQMANVAGITEDYLEVLGIPVLHGRGIQRSDRGGLPVAIVSNALARSIWGDSQAAIGQRIALDSNTLFEIVGVVGDVRQWAVPRNGEYIYVPEWHIWEPTYVELTLPFRFTSYFLVSTRTDINQLRPLLQKSIREIEPGQPVEEIKAVPELIATAFGPWRSYVSLLAGFAVVALLLSAVGVYGVISYNVAKRTQEIGLRMALGATPKDILRLIITRGFYLAMAGIVVGAVAAYWLTQVIETLLYGVKRTDPVTFTCVAMVLLATALFACYLPARHAAQLNPATSLRSE